MSTGTTSFRTSDWTPGPDSGNLENSSRVDGWDTFGPTTAQSASGAYSDWDIINSSEPFVRADWSRPNSTVTLDDLSTPGPNLNFTEVADRLSETAAQQSAAESEVSEASAASGGLPSAIGGALLTTANREFTNYENSSRTTQANLGLTREGHSFLAPIHTEIENTNASNLTSIENLEIGLGSAFGPEGLLAGTVAAGITALVGPSFQQSENVVNSTNGTLV